MLHSYLGELVALATAICWTVSPITFSLLAIQYTATGIASTIMSISRIIIIPVSIMIFHEKVMKKEIIGAFISILGVGILFL